MSLVNNLNYSYDNFKLSVSEWEIPDQGMSLLYGRSGIGKTTLFRILIGLEVCPGFQWIFNGQDLAQQPVPMRNLGVVFQDYRLFPHLSVYENLSLIAKAKKVEQAKKSCEELMDVLDLTNLKKQKAGTLSGGEQQRVALARALVGNPQFLFLDEAFSALDTELRSKAKALTKQVIEDYKIPSLMISHDPEDKKYTNHHFELKKVNNISTI